MEKNKKYMRNTAFKIITVMLLTVMLSGCGLKNSYKIQMYYLSGEGNQLTSEKYKIYESDSVGSAAAQVMDSIMEEAERGSTRALLSSDVTMYSVTVTDGKAVVDFSSEYLSMDKTKEVLARAGIVDTLTQIEGIDSVSFMVEQSPLTNSKGAEIGEMTADTFVDNSGRTDIATVQPEDVEE